MIYHGLSSYKSLLATLAVVAALVFGVVTTEGKDRTKTVTFLNDVTVGETVVPKGTYNVRFNSGANEVTFQQNGRLVATVRVEVEATTRRNPHHSTAFVEEGNGRVLKRISFQGDQRTLVVTSTTVESSAGSPSLDEKDEQ
jgi:hypothetical protein